MPQVLLNYFDFGQWNVPLPFAARNHSPQEHFNQGEIFP